MEKVTLLEFSVPVPKIGIGKHKNQLALMNNAHVWLRYYKTKIKDTFKQLLGDWFIPVCDKEPRKYGTVEFQLYRPNKKRIDADSIAYEGKWLVDFLVEQKWFVDDDSITFIYKPAIVSKDLVETTMKITVSTFN